MWGVEFGRSKVGVGKKKRTKSEAYHLWKGCGNISDGFMDWNCMITMDIR